MRLALLLPLALAVSPALAAEFVLVGPEIPPAPIVLATDAPPRTREVAEVLAGYVERISGHRPPVLEGRPDPLPARAVWVGVQPAVRDLFPGTDFDFKHPEEIVIAAIENHLVVAGRDLWNPEKPDLQTEAGLVKGVQQEYGTVNAVYTFLQDQLGVRWFWPGELGEDVPVSQRIAVRAPFEYRHHPQIRARGGIFNYSSLGNRGYGRAQEWTMRQRLQLDSLSIEGGHGFGDWWDRYHEEHPDIFALQPDGTRSGFPSPRNAKLCMTNPKVWELWLEDVARELEQDPHRTVFNASPNDGWASGHCVCERCSAWDHPEGEPRVFNWSKRNEERPATSDRDVIFANTLASLLKEKYPDKDYRVLMLSYGHSRPAPVSARPEKVIMTVVANFFGRTGLVDRGSTRGDTYREQFDAWAEIVPSMFWRPNTGSPAGWQQGLPDLHVAQTIRDFKDVAAANCIGIYIDAVWEHWSTVGPLYYIMAQLAWNPGADAEAVLEDYYARAFGPAAGHVRDYFETLEEQRMAFVAANPEAGVFGFAGLFTEELLRDSAARLDLAAAAAPTESTFARRIGFVRAGLTYTEMQMENIRLMEGYWKEPSPEVAARVRRNWEAIETHVATFPYAINWGPVRPTTPRMLPLHPDGEKPKARRARANDLDQN